MRSYTDDQNTEYGAKRALIQERRTSDRERTQKRHAGRVAKYAPTRGAAGAWS